VATAAADMEAAVVDRKPINVTIDRRTQNLQFVAHTSSVNLNKQITINDSSSWDSNSDPNYTIPDRRNFDDYSQAPADRRPELLNIPSVELDRRFGKNERNPQVNPLAVPPTSTRIIPPPELPPQPLASNSRSPRQQLLPPTNFPSSRNSGQSHAGHDHSGHDHSGHNH